MRYRDVVIEASDVRDTRRADTHWSRSFKIRVLSSPAGEMAPDVAVVCEYDDTTLQEQLTKLEARALDQAGLVALGGRLADLLLPSAANGEASSVRDMFLRSVDLVGQDVGIRLRLRLPSELAALPWEFAHVAPRGTSGGMAGFLSLNAGISIVRHEALPAAVPTTPIQGDITIVAAFAAPRAPDLDDIDLEREERDLRALLEHRPGVEARFVTKATLDGVQSVISNAHVFHFSGHGAYRQQPGPQPRTTMGRGELVMEDQRVDAETLAINLQRNGVRLVVLESCESGRRGGVNIWGAISSTLVRCHVPAVVANQYKVLDTCALAFSRQFYNALVGGLPLEQAVAAGRIAAYNADQNGRDWGVPLLYLRAEHGQLFEGAADATARRRARETVEQFLVQQGVVIQAPVSFGPMIVNVGDMRPREDLPPKSFRDTDSEQLSAADGTAPQVSPQTLSAEVARDRTEVPDARRRLDAISEALRPVLLGMIAELEPADIEPALQDLFDLSYEVARGTEADAGVVAKRVTDLAALVPCVMPRLRDLLGRSEFGDLAASATLTDITQL